jgi:phospholysine phosphohistidine inorganic pyrophosphate phosphatase
VQGILFDMDGVLYNGEEAIEGAAESVSWVQAQQIPHLFVTNTTSRGRASLVEKLAGFGIRTDKKLILTPCVAAGEWLRTNREGAAALFIRPEAGDEFAGVEQVAPDAESGARYIVIGDLGDAWDFRTLNRAFRLLQSDPQSVLVALGMTRFWRAQDGLRLDVAPFIAALELATGRTAVVFGKPSERFFLSAVGLLRLQASEIVMVGDDVRTDIAGSQRAGLKGLLTKTGKFRQIDLEGDVVPDVILESVRDLPAWWKGGRP